MAPTSKVKSWTVHPFSMRIVFRAEYRAFFLMADTTIRRSNGAVSSPQIIIILLWETKRTSGRSRVGTSVIGQQNVPSRSIWNSQSVARSKRDGVGALTDFGADSPAFTKTLRRGPVDLLDRLFARAINPFRSLSMHLKILL